MSTITPQGARPARQRQHRGPTSTQATQNAHDHKATLTLVALVLLVGAVAVLWFAVLTDSDSSTSSTPVGSTKPTQQQLRELARGSDRHLYQRQPQDVAASVRHESWSDLPDGSDRHLYLLPRH